jgi:hypothetical protein
MTESTRSTRWQTIDRNPDEIGAFLEAAARLASPMKRKSIDALRLMPG